MSDDSPSQAKLSLPLFCEVIINRKKMQTHGPPPPEKNYRYVSFSDSLLTDAFNDESNLFFFVQVLGPELGAVRLEVRDLARSHRQYFLSLCPQAT